MGRRKGGQRGRISNFQGEHARFLLSYEKDWDPEHSKEAGEKNGKLYDVMTCDYLLEYDWPVWFDTSKLCIGVDRESLEPYAREELEEEEIKARKRLRRVFPLTHTNR